MLGAGKLHGDDVLEPGNGKTKTGRLWTDVRDDRPAGNEAALAVWFASSADRKGEHPAAHLKNYRGICRPMAMRVSTSSTKRAHPPVAKQAHRAGHV